MQHVGEHRGCGCWLGRVRGRGQPHFMNNAARRRVAGRGGAGRGWRAGAGAGRGRGSDGRKMAALKEARSYGLSCGRVSDGSKVSVFHVKLTDSALKAFESYRARQVSGSGSLAAGADGGGRGPASRAWPGSAGLGAARGSGAAGAGWARARSAATSPLMEPGRHRRAATAGPGASEAALREPGPAVRPGTWAGSMRTWRGGDSAVLGRCRVGAPGRGGGVTASVSWEAALISGCLQGGGAAIGEAGGSGNQGLHLGATCDPFPETPGGAHC